MNTLLLAVLALPSSQDLAPIFRLHPPTVEADSDRPLVSPDQKTIVTETVSSSGGSTVRDLYLFSVATGSYAQVVGPGLPAGGTQQVIASFTPDGGRLVYSVDGVYSSVPVDLSAPVVSLAPWTVRSLLPDGATAVATDGSNDLYRIDLEGVDPPVFLGGPLEGIYVRRAGDRVLYLSRIGGPPELYSVPIDGSAPQTKLSAPLPTGAQVVAFPQWLTPDELTCVYEVFRSLSSYWIFSVPVDGSAPAVQIASVLNLGYTQVTPDGSFFVYQAEDATSQLEELFTAPVDGSAPPVKLSSVLAGATESVQEFWISADSAWVVFRQKKRPGYAQELLFSVPVGGGPLNRLSQNNNGHGYVTLSQDSGRVTWQQRQSRDLLGVPIDGPATSAVKLYSGTTAVRHDVAPDSAAVVYSATDIGCWSVPPAGGTSTLLSVPPTGSAYFFDAFSPDGRWVYFLEHDPTQIYRAEVGRGASAVRISDPAEGYASLPALSPDGRLLVYKTFAPTTAWVVGAPPDVDSVKPARGPATGGTSVTIRGAGFTPAAKVLFGELPAASVVFVDDSKLRAVTPAFGTPPGRRALGRVVDVTVTDQLGTRTTLPNAFAYSR